MCRMYVLVEMKDILCFVHESFDRDRFMTRDIKLRMRIVCDGEYLKNEDTLDISNKHFIYLNPNGEQLKPGDLGYP